MEGNISSSAQAEPLFAPDNWRYGLPPDARQRIVNKIMDTLKRHLPITVPEGLNELEKIATRFEEKIYSAASSQADYLRKISLKMLTMENKSQHSGPINGRPDQGVPVFASDGGGCSTNWRTQLKIEVRQRTINRIMDSLRRHVPISVPEDLNELQKIAIQFEEKIYTMATNKCSYSRKITLKLRSLEMNAQRYGSNEVVKLLLLTD